MGFIYKAKRYYLLQQQCIFFVIIVNNNNYNAPVYLFFSLHFLFSFVKYLLLYSFVYRYIMGTPYYQLSTVTFYTTVNFPLWIMQV